MVVLEYPSQKMRALDKANAVRTALAELKQHLAGFDRREGALEAARILGEQPGRVAGLKVHDFLDAIPGVGESKVQSMLMRRGEYIWPLKRMRQLTVRQRMRIVGELVGFAAGPLPRPLTVMEEAILAAIGRSAVPVPAADLADELGLCRLGLGGRLLGLERRGLVCRVVLVSRKRPVHGWCVRGELAA